jgi:hypothetical protein
MQEIPRQSQLQCFAVNVNIHKDVTIMMKLPGGCFALEPHIMCRTRFMKTECLWKVEIWQSVSNFLYIYEKIIVHNVSSLLTEIKDMNVNELTKLVNLDFVTAWRIKRCIDADSDSTKQPWERTGGVPLASSDWGLLETEWDPARGCITSPSPCACQTAAIAHTTAEGEFACKAIAAGGIEKADEVLISDCLTNLGFPSAVSVQVRSALLLACRGRQSDGPTVGRCWRWACRAGSWAASPCSSTPYADTLPAPHATCVPPKPPPQWMGVCDCLSPA